MWIEQQAAHGKFHDNWSTVSKLTTKGQRPKKIPTYMAPEE